MTDTTKSEASQFTLDHDIAAGDKVMLPAGTVITIRRPKAGALRGLKLLDLTQLDVAALQKLAPRITNPILHEALAREMELSDLMQFGAEVVDFLLPTRTREDLPTA